MTASVGDVVRNRHQPFLVGVVTKQKFTVTEVRLDTGGLVMWAHGAYEPVIVHYYQDSQGIVFRMDIDPDTLQIIGCWIAIHGHWERAPRGTAAAIEFSGDYVGAQAPAT